ncbi:hypothetical protein D3C85_1517080 [compost metagenome]
MIRLRIADRFAGHGAFLSGRGPRSDKCPFGAGVAARSEDRAYVFVRVDQTAGMSPKRPLLKSVTA